MAPRSHPFPFRPDEAEKWPILQAGAVMEYTLHPKESCVVYFFVDGHGFNAVASSDDDRINLIHTDTALCAEVQRAPGARAAKADRTARAV